MERLRPIERRVLAMRDDGLATAEIADRIRRSPDHVERMIQWTDIPRSGPPPRTSARAMERRVLALRSLGLDHDEIAARFRRGPRFIRQVEGLAHYRRALEILA